MTGQRVNQVLPLALTVQEERMARLGTSVFNRVLMRAQDEHATRIQDRAHPKDLLRHPRCAATRPPLCCTSTIPSWRTSPTCAIWKTAFARNTHSQEHRSAWF